MNPRPSLERPQTTDTIVMVRPDFFRYNQETESTNSFQEKMKASDGALRFLALLEFREAVEKLRSHLINVITLKSPNGEVETPDAVFPNNWFTTHSDGTLIVYPLLGKTRRHERQVGRLGETLTQHGFQINDVWDLRRLETGGHILEGTGSIILHRRLKTAFANRSERTNEQLFDAVCAKRGYRGVFFEAEDELGKPMYHTNLHMSIGEGFAVYSSESIERAGVNTIKGDLESLGVDLVDISIAQVRQMCGNILNLQSTDGSSKIVMSRTALRGFSHTQRAMLERHGELVPLDISTIERIGGGSARCMMAEIFLPRNQRLTNI